MIRTQSISVFDAICKAIYVLATADLFKPRFRGTRDQISQNLCPTVKISKEIEFHGGNIKKRSPFLWTAVANMLFIE